MRTVLLLACCVVLLCASSPASAQPRIVVTDNNCAHFPDGLGSSVTSGATIILDTDLSVDSNGDDCIVIANVTRVQLMLNGHSINLSGIGLAGIRVENSSRVEIIGPGKIAGFAWGVRIVGSSEVLVSRVISRGRGVGKGIALVSSSDARLEGNILFEHLQGIEVSTPFPSPLSARNVVSQNEVFTNRNGMSVQGLRNTVSGNNVSGNRGLGILVGGTGGLNTIINNIVLGNGFFDIDRNSSEQDSDIIENNICEVSEPPGLCPALIPDFDIDH
jgi:parallel beta-helix repeat protein